MTHIRGAFARKQKPSREGTLERMIMQEKCVNLFAALIHSHESLRHRKIFIFHRRRRAKCDGCDEEIEDINTGVVIFSPHHHSAYALHKQGFGWCSIYVNLKMSLLLSVTAFLPRFASTPNIVLMWCDAKCLYRLLPFFWPSVSCADYSCSAWNFNRPSLPKLCWLEHFNEMAEVLQISAPLSCLVSTIERGDQAAGTNISSNFVCWKLSLGSAPHTRKMLSRPEECLTYGFCVKLMMKGVNCGVRREGRKGWKG